MNEANQGSAAIGAGSSGNYPGLNRLEYFLWLLGVIVIGGIVAGLLSVVDESAFWIGYAGLVIGMLYIGMLRMDNLGSTRWLVLLSFVPLLNLVYSIYALAYPPGYQQHKELDTTTYVIIGIFVVLIIIPIAAIAVG